MSGVILNAFRPGIRDHRVVLVRPESNLWDVNLPTLKKLTSAEAEVVDRSLHVLHERSKGDLDTYKAALNRLGGTAAFAADTLNPSSFNYDSESFALTHLAADVANVSLELTRFADRALGRAAARGGEEMKNRASQLISQAYDSSIHYKLLHAVRNLYAHSDGAVLLPSIRFPNEQGGPIAIVEVLLNRDLVRNSKLSKSKRNEIEALEADPNMFECAMRSGPVLAELDNSLWELIHPLPSLQKHVDAVSEYFLLASASGGIPMIRAIDGSEPVSIPISKEVVSLVASRLM